eukprot:6235471-Pyramimonas_sp.AAC.3
MLCLLKSTKCKQLSDPLVLENLHESRPEDDEHNTHGQCKLLELVKHLVPYDSLVVPANRGPNAVDVVGETSEG